MYSVLNISNDLTHCGNIGHTSEDVSYIVAVAKKFGFSGINLDLRDPDVGSDELKRVLDDNQIKPVSFGLYCDLFSPSDDKFQLALESFKQQAKYAHEIGCDLALCYIPPFSEELTFNDLFNRTVARLKLIKPILFDYDIRIGFEFIGPTETRLSSNYDFIHTIDGVRALIAASGLYGYGGIKLDIHHWQNSGAGILDLHHLDLDYIYYVELNDAKVGFDIFSTPEFQRELPFTTGVTDINGFMQVLKAKGYKGPVAIEPWNSAIKKMPFDEAIARVKQSLDQCLRLVGVCENEQNQDISLNLV